MTRFRFERQCLKVSKDRSEELVILMASTKDRDKIFNLLQQFE